MKRISDLRHAKSSYDQPELADVDRPLSERGRKAAARLGKELGHRGMRFDLVLASTAVRVRETIEVIEQSFDLPQPVRFEQRLYLASTALLIEIIRAFPENVRSPLLIGHNPGLEQLLLELSHHDQRGLREKVAGKYPTAAFAVVELPADRWDRIEPGSGTIIELILPRALDQ